MKGASSRAKIASGWARYDNYTISLTSYARTKTEDGGWTVASASVRPPQIFGVALVQEDKVITVFDGTERRLGGWLVGPVGALIAVGDRFDMQGLKMMVSGIRRAPDGVYAEVVHYGR